MAKLDILAELREERREVRDGLLELIEAVQSKNVGKARKILDRINVLVRPLFIFEEKALYPTLKVFLGERADQLVKEHDTVIKTARSYAELLKKESLTDEEARQGVDAVRVLLIHLSYCDGLAILFETLKSEKLEHLAKKITEPEEEDATLLS
jgi:hypothetical protein